MIMNNEIQAQDIDQVHRNKNCSKYLIPAPTMVGGKKSFIPRQSKMLSFRTYFAQKRNFERDTNCFIQNLSYYIYYQNF